MTKRKLQQIYYLNKEIDMWQKKLVNKNSKSYIKTQQITGMPFGSGITDNTANRAIDTADIDLIIRGKLAEIQAVSKDIMQFISEIDDSLMRQIICYRNIDLLQWNEIAKLIGGNNTENSIKQMYSRFLKTL